MANLNLKTRVKYGFTWPAQMSDPQIELVLWKKWKEAPYNQLVTGPQATEHGLRAARALFSSKDLTISPWTEDHFLDWTTETFVITWGGASCSKSNDYGCMALLDWIVDPIETTTIFASTTKGMLKLRSWESVTRYFRLLKSNPYFSVPGREAAVSTAIINEEETKATEKGSLRGLAVREGSEERARANLAGQHNTYVRTLLDEISQMPRAALDSRVNAKIGSTDYRFFGLANPDSYHDLGASVSVPETEGGWNDVDRETTEWRSSYGKVRHHNGMHSPAITEEGGAERYPYLINQSTVDDLVKESRGNLDSPVVWSQLYGFPPPEGNILTVLSNKDMVAFSTQKEPEWHPEFTADHVHVAGFDPAFSNGGDNAVLQTGTVGVLQTGQYALALDDPEYIPIAVSEERPIAYQLSDYVINRLEQLSVPIGNLAIDDSGTQSVADIVQVEGHIAPIRCNFGARASDSPISTINPEPAYKRVGNQVTEIWVLFAELARHGQVRGLTSVPASQFTSRAFVPGRRPQRLESKEDYRKRTGQSSPDEGDAVALCALAARKAAGLFPGSDKKLMPWVGAGESNPNFGRDPGSNYQSGPGGNMPRGYVNSGLDFHRTRGV